ncbi:MAG: class I SAM-dependent methyltransferase [Clostridia bacterium]|nr:class I SAM-dependent methyltransferase [Clostridia bacterium]
MKLFRPLGIRELELIKLSGMTKFPPRLPEQPIFYPVLNIEYAWQIAQEWNTKSAPGFAGFVTEFEMDDHYISKFEVKTVGSNMHKELWVPAEELDDFNRHIIGSIKVIETYYGEDYQGSKFCSLKSNSIAAIEKLKSGSIEVLKSEKWLKFLALTSERNINFERLNSLDEIKNNYVLRYVEESLSVLSEIQLGEYQTKIVEETLKWSEVAKSGLAHQRIQWIKKGYNLFAHNIGSAEIYLDESGESDLEIKRIVHDLILTHGLIGQYIRGEVPLSENKPLYQLVKENKISDQELKEILKALNCCIVSAVDENIWREICKQVDEVIELVINGQFDKGYELKERIRHLRAVSIRNGENFDVEYKKIFSDPRIIDKINTLLETADLWYVEAALFDFSFEEFIKVFLMIAQQVSSSRVKHISFEWLMKDIYYQHEGKKRVNIYKKRIIEKYLSDITIEDILKGKYKDNLHVVHEVSFHENLDDTVFFTFRFSAAGSKLIEFCTEAEKSDFLYESAIILLFDLFGLRKDKYDRFYEEETYLQTMNQSIDYKKVILDYIIGDSIIDIGPGGGALMNMIEERYPEKKVSGVDIAQNVLDNLKRKKQLESRKWDVLYGDALNLGQYIAKGSVDTIIFCSILHELFSYIEFNGKKFNHETLASAFRSAFEVLPSGGRIIIRDGIMTEPVSQKRIIRFLSEEGMEFLKRYVKDFKGREIEYTVVGQNEVIMPVNDAMEFLYTYTWGEKSYVHEVNEQFGYFTPSGFKELIASVLGKEAKIIEFKHFLQEGYTIALSQKIEFFDENRNPAKLPDSTCIVVVEKN